MPPFILKSGVLLHILTRLLRTVLNRTAVIIHTKIDYCCLSTFLVLILYLIIIRLTGSGSASLMRSVVPRSGRKEGKLSKIINGTQEWSRWANFMALKSMNWCDFNMIIKPTIVFAIRAWAACGFYTLAWVRKSSKRMRLTSKWRHPKQSGAGANGACFLLSEFLQG